MRVIVNHPVNFFGIDYPKGVHDVPEKVFKHPFFELLLKDKKIVLEGGKTFVSKLETIQERNERLAAQIRKEFEDKKQKVEDEKLDEDKIKLNNEFDEGEFEFDDSTDDDDSNEIEFEEPESLEQKTVNAGKKKKRKR